MKKQQIEKFVTLFPEQGVGVLNGAFINDPNLRCTSKGMDVIKRIMEKLSKQGFKKLNAPPHLDGRDTDLIRFFEELGFRKWLEMYAFERNLQEPLPTLSKIPNLQIEVMDMATVSVDELFKALNDAFMASITQQSPMTKEELTSRIEGEKFLKQASLQASIRGRIVSFVLMSARSDTIADLDYQGTVPEYRRKGLGLHLLSRSLLILRNMRFQKLIVEQVLPQSNAEILLLQKADFRFSHSQFNMSMDFHEQAHTKAQNSSKQIDSTHLSSLDCM